MPYIYEYILSLYFAGHYVDVSVGIAESGSTTSPAASSKCATSSVSTSAREMDIAPESSKYATSNVSATVRETDIVPDQACSLAKQSEETVDVDFSAFKNFEEVKEYVLTLPRSEHAKQLFRYARFKYATSYTTSANKSQEEEEEKAEAR